MIISILRKSKERINCHLQFFNNLLLKIQNTRAIKVFSLALLFLLLVLWVQCMKKLRLVTAVWM